MTGAGARTTRLKRNERPTRAALFGVVLTAALAMGACTPMGGGADGGPQTSADAPQDAFTGVEMSLWKSGQDAESNNQYDQAAGAFLNLYNRYPDNQAVAEALMRNLRYAGHAKDAVRVIEEGAHEAMLANPGLRFEYAKALLAAGRKTDALGAFEQTAQMMPENWRVFSGMGIAFDATGNYGAAIGAYQRALSLSPDNPVILNNLAMSQAMSGQLQSAITTLETAAGLNRSNPHIRQNLALLYAINGDEDKAKALAAMDLSASDLENNMTFYRRFEGGKK